MIEEWRSVKGFERVYEISNLGRLRGIRSGKIIKVNPKLPHGYLQVQLYNRAPPIAKLIHRLVLEAFDRLGLPGEEGRHLDGNKTNCRLDNLCWGTSEQNKQDELIGGRNTVVKLTPAQVLFLRNTPKEAVNYKVLAKSWNVTTATLRNAKFKRTYTHI